MAKIDFGSQAGGQSGAPQRSRRPRSDFGTFLLHWVMAIAMIMAMITGFRISWDAENARFSRWIAGILLQGDVWTIHFIAACVMFACATGYVVYLARASLFGRNALARLRILMLEAPASLKWQSINIGLHWGFYLLTIVMMITGVMLYLGWGGIVVDIHAAVAIALVVYLFLHIIGHFMQGGWAQIFRIFLPQALVTGPMTKAYPLLIALAIGFATSAGVTALDFGTRDTLIIPKVAKSPKLDGVLDDETWKGLIPVRIRTQQGFHLAGGRGESNVEVRATHDGENIYFAFRWEDPTRTLKRLPLIKKEDGWHLLHNRADIADEYAYYEDKFAVLFSRSDAFGSGGTTYMGPKPLADKPAPISGRGYHYTADGTYADMWQWKASRGGHLGKIDDMHFGPPYAASATQAAGKERYQAGYLQDPGKAFYIYNYVGEPPGGFRGPVTLRRLPKDYKAMTAKLGKIDLGPGASDDEGSQWWMFEDETVPYSKELDAAIPVGTIMPSTMIFGVYEGDRDDVAGEPKWKDGWWTLETRRKLVAKSKYDIDFTEKKPLYMWVAVFDNNQVRHTRHVRPVKIQLR